MLTFGSREKNEQNPTSAALSGKEEGREGKGREGKGREG